jgi:hypothetical protein
VQDGKTKVVRVWYFLVSFFLEQVPQMQPQVALIAHPMTEPHMERWTNLSPRLGNEPSTFIFIVNFFAWWRRKLVVIEDFPYARVDFQGSADLVLPEGIQWDASDMKLNMSMYFFYIVLYLYNEESKNILFHHADKGASCAMEMPALGRHRGDTHVASEHHVVVGGI